MKPFAFALILALVPVSAWANRGDQGAQDDAAVIDRSDLIDRLEHIDALLSEALGRMRPKDRSVPALRRARDELSSLESDLLDSPNPREWVRGQRDRERWFRDDPAPPPPSADRRPPPPPAPAPMPEPSVAQLAAVLDSQPTLQGRMQTLQVAASANSFLVRQAQVLITRFNPGPDRAAAIRILSPRLLDRENEYLLTPGVAPAPPPDSPPSPYARLTVRSSFAARSNVKLQPGLYKGNFGVPGSVTVEGSGRDQTVIDGDLVVSGPFNTVKNLTVLGKVVITGSQNTLVDVDYRGGVEDRGLINKY
jgi:hypothetical protein